MRNAKTFSLAAKNFKKVFRIGFKKEKKYDLNQQCSLSVGMLDQSCKKVKSRILV